MFAGAIAKSAEPSAAPPVDRLQHLFPTTDLFDDGVGVGGPDEGLGVLIGCGEEPVDRSLEIDDASEDPVFETLPGQLGEEALDGIEPGGRGRGAVEMEPLVPFAPGLDPGLRRGRFLGCLCVAWLSTIRCNSRPAGVSRLILSRKRTNS
jgi:hypothetical protein